ncbi:DUF2750 domain-containing protein [Thalassotalea sp. ND16A]|uniref:DUF2750 domain-containing protein n=1 Tax=Thalassotalea sp. ND16A TaxID=1535422 RepID=UPI00051A2F57|nr:DUF2750 domain-containing protein [Thalassotalea sp. ND16A]KGK00606.1 hypothetical protein ND16A_3366 [Thalassotalea sp. ND16A]
MTTTPAEFSAFVETVNEDEQLFALQNENGDWVVCDSVEFENSDVMPVWASAADAQLFCIDEWQSYSVASINLEQFLEEWIGDLNEDGVLIGVNWQTDSEGKELDAIEFAKLLVKAL